MKQVEGYCLHSDADDLSSLSKSFCSLFFDFQVAHVTFPAFLPDTGGPHTASA